MSHFKTIPGKDIGNDPNDPNDTTDISFEIPDDSIQSGMGMPITMRLCRQIVSDYYTLQKKTFNAINMLTSKPSNDISEDDIQAVRSGVDPEKEIVSGVYGRDTLMHLLEQKGCEGIRYLNCIYGGEKSIVLLGVDKDGKPIGGEDKFLTDNPEPNVVLYEVKGGSKSMNNILDMIPETPSEDGITSDVKNGIIKALL